MSEEKAEASDFIQPVGPVKFYLSTGSTVLDLAIANRIPGGFPAGRVSQIYGSESTGKSLVGGEVLGSAQRQAGKASLNDTEGTWDVDRAKLLHGVRTEDASKWEYTASETIEDLFDEYIANLVKACQRIRGPSCSVIDTLSAIPSKAEKDTALDKSTMGTSRAKQLSAAFRKYIDSLNDVNLALVFLDQTRENVGVMFGDPETVSGGKAVKFYASVRVRLSMQEKILNTSDKVIGVKLGFIVKKNKIAPPFREGSFRVLFDYGIDDIASNLEWLHENDPDQAALAAEKDKADKAARAARGEREDKEKDKEKAKKKKTPWMFSLRKGQEVELIEASGLYDLVGKIEERKLERELVQEVIRVWNIVYQTPERKARVRGEN